MIVIHATKKLYTKLPLDSQGGIVTKKPEPPQEGVAIANNPLSGWHANLITLQRRNCVLLVHDATRFPLFIKSLVKSDFAELDWLFADALMNTLLKLDANQAQLDAVAALLAPCQFDTNCNRSVQGTMNQMKGDVEHTLWFNNTKIEDLSSYRTGAWLADRPCSIKGMKDCIWPIKSMLKLLETGQNTQTTKQDSNVVQLADYRGDSNS